MKLRVLVIAVLLAALVLTAAPPQTTVTIEVKDQYGKPVDNAEVILDFLGSRQVTKLGKRRATHWEVHSNQSGVAHFPPVPQGTLQVQVVAKHFQTFGDKVDVNETEKKIEVKLNPPQPQYSAHPPLKPATPEQKQTPEPKQ
jgi:hypothetical protein